MSTIANWAYTRDLTLWMVDFDTYGQPTYSFVRVQKGTYQIVKALAADGNIPTAEAASGTDTFYLEYLGEDPPEVGWMIALGDFTGEDPPATAKKITTVTQFDTSMFGEAIPDYKLEAV